VKPPLAVHDRVEYLALKRRGQRGTIVETLEAGFVKVRRDGDQNANWILEPSFRLRKLNLLEVLAEAAAGL